LNIWLLLVAVPVHNLVLEITPVAVVALAVC
jgi:hypothetical protein